MGAQMVPILNEIGVHCSCMGVSQRRGPGHSRGPSTALYPPNAVGSTSTLASSIPPSFPISSPSQNHDFDYGLPNLLKLNSQCKFPWLMANVLDRATGTAAAGVAPCAGQEANPS